MSRPTSTGVMLNQSGTELTLDLHAGFGRCDIQSVGVAGLVL